MTIRSARPLGAALLLLSLMACPITPPPDPPPTSATRNILPPPGITTVKVLPQNWTDAQSNEFYNMRQGSTLLPYKWFLSLEQPDSALPFRSEEFLRGLGYIPRKPDPAANPDGLPVGFVRDGEDLGLTCAACHTSLITYKQTAWIVDGGPAMADFEMFQKSLQKSLLQTETDAQKFARFAGSILGTTAGASDTELLKQQLSQKRQLREAYNQRNLPASEALRFGPARVDAIGAIFNEVCETFAGVPGNAEPANAPVSYPCLWDTPQHDWVEWNGAVENTLIPGAKLFLGTDDIGALGRNSGEVLGVFGWVHPEKEGDTLHLHGYPSSISRGNLVVIENLLRGLWSPLLKETGIPVPKEEEALVAAGRSLFVENCAKCHADIQRDDPNRTVKANMQAVGTDQTMAANFATRKAKSGVLTGRKFELQSTRTLEPVEPVQNLLFHVVQRAVLYPEAVTPTEELASAFLGKLPAHREYRVVGEIRLNDTQKMMAEIHLDELVDRKVKSLQVRNILQMTNGHEVFLKGLLKDATSYEKPDGTKVPLLPPSAPTHAVLQNASTLSFQEPKAIPFAYKARPLNGIWATAPYLHNGSVPTLDQLLTPAQDRKDKFFVGSREFDPEKVGFDTEHGLFQFDTHQPGNSNSGHDYGFQDPQQRKALIAYLKTL